MLLANCTGRELGPMRQASMLLLLKGGHGTFTKSTDKCKRAAEKQLGGRPPDCLGGEFQACIQVRSQKHA